MAPRRMLAVLCLSVALAAAWGCGRREAEPPDLGPTRGAPAAPAAPPAAPDPTAPEPADPRPEPGPRPEPIAAPTPPPPPAPPPIEEPVDERPHWQQVLDSQEPGALTGRRRPSSEGTAKAPASPQGQAPEKVEPKQPAAAPAAPAPTGKGRTYCTWQYYASLRYLCTDLEPAEAKAKCDTQQTAALGEPVDCVCVPAEGYAPQCL